MASENHPAKKAAAKKATPAKKAPAKKAPAKKAAPAKRAEPTAPAAAAPTEENVNPNPGEAFKDESPAQPQQVNPFPDPVIDDDLDPSNDLDSYQTSPRPASVDDPSKDNDDMQDDEK